MIQACALVLQCDVVGQLATVNHVLAVYLRHVPHGDDVAQFSTFIGAVAVEMIAVETVYAQVKDVAFFQRLVLRDIQVDIGGFTCCDGYLLLGYHLFGGIKGHAPIVFFMGIGQVDAHLVTVDAHLVHLEVG